MSSPIIAGIIVARMDSSRLPGKALADLGGRPLLEWVYRRAELVVDISEIAIATTTRSIDDPIASLGSKLGIRVYRGQRDDVVSRVLACSKAIGADWFFRLNGDSPFPDPGLLATAIKRLSSTSLRPDLISNLGSRSFPYGIAVELLRTDALAQSATESLDANSREHLTQDIYRRANKFTISYIDHPETPLKNARLVVDDPSDLERMRQIISGLGKPAGNAGWQVLAEAYLKLWPPTAAFPHSSVAYQ